MFYKVTQGEIREDNPSIDAVEEFSKCTSVELKYIMLLYDYETPFRELDWESRKNRAALAAGYNKSKSTGGFVKKAQEVLDGKVEHVQAAAIIFQALQKDIDKEALEAYNAQLEQFIAKAKEPKENNRDWDLALKINSALPKMLRERSEISDLLNIRGTEIEEELLDDEQEEVHSLSSLDIYNQELIDDARK